MANTNTLFTYAELIADIQAKYGFQVSSKRAPDSRDDNTIDISIETIAAPNYDANLSLRCFVYNDTVFIDKNEYDTKMKSITNKLTIIKKFSEAMSAATAQP